MASRRSFFAVLSCVGLMSGCSSSTTTPPKSADDQVHELIAKVQSLSEADRRAQGPAISGQIMALKGKVSEATKKEIDALYSTVVSVRENSPTDSAHVDTNSSPMPVDIDVTMPVSRPSGPELAPLPREVKK